MDESRTPTPEEMGLVEGGDIIQEEKPTRGWQAMPEDRKKDIAERLVAGIKGKE